MNVCAVVLATGLNGLGMIRSLAKAGYESIAIISSNDDLSATSSLPKKIVTIPMDENWESSVLTYLNQLELNYAAPLLACSDRAVAFLVEYRAQLGRFAILTPSKVTVDMLNDKRTELEYVIGAGVPLPKSLPDIERGVVSNKLSGMTFPLIVKPRTFKGYQTINAKNIILSSDHDWDVFYTRYQEHLSELIIQEVIPGDDENLWVCNATFDNESNMVAAFSFMRIGTMPAHFGVTSMALSEDNVRVKELCAKLGKALNYSGPAMFEFKYDVRVDDYLYIEINPRFGMCNWFDTSCGVNNVDATCRILMGQPVPSMRQISGLLYWNVLGDLVARLEDREALGSIMKRYVKYLFKKKVWPVYKFGDAKPFRVSVVARLIDIYKRLVKRLK